MQADKQIRLILFRNFRAFRQRKEIIAIPRQIDFHIGRALLKNRLDFFGEIQHDVFFFQAAGADCAGVMAAMTGVEYNNMILIVFEFLRDLLLLDSLLLRLFLHDLIEQIHDHTIRLIVQAWQHLNSGFNRARQIEHDLRRAGFQSLHPNAL